MNNELKKFCFKGTTEYDGVLLAKNKKDASRKLHQFVKEKMTNTNLQKPDMVGVTFKSLIVVFVAPIYIWDVSMSNIHFFDKLGIISLLSCLVMTFLFELLDDYDSYKDYKKYVADMELLK